MNLAHLKICASKKCFKYCVIEEYLLSLLLNPYVNCQVL